MDGYVKLIHDKETRFEKKGRPVDKETFDLLFKPYFDNYYIPGYIKKKEVESKIGKARPLFLQWLIMKNTEESIRCLFEFLICENIEVNKEKKIYISIIDKTTPYSRFKMVFGMGDYDGEVFIKFNVECKMVGYLIGELTKNKIISDETYAQIITVNKLFKKNKGTYFEKGQIKSTVCNAYNTPTKQSSKKIKKLIDSIILEILSIHKREF